MNERYSRLTLIPWWDQNRLRASKALVVGAGALGNELVKNLTLLGLGEIFVVDMDRIESSNLSRSVLFRQADVGKFKARVIAEHANELNPDVKVVPIVGRFEDEVGLDLLREMDLVFAGLDSRLARLNIGRACRLVGKPWIDGAIEALHGIARVFGSEGPCYECTLNEIDLELIAKRKSCALISKEEAEEGKVPTTPTMASIVAGFQVQEGIKLLHDGRKLPVMLGRGFFINGLTHDSYTIDYQEKKDCPSHERLDELIDIDESHDASIGAVVSAIKNKVTDVSSISLGREVVIAERCIPCNIRNIVGRPPLAWVKEEAKCKKCGKSLQPVLAQDLSDFTELEIRTLSECGVPDRDIVRAVIGERLIGLVLKPSAMKKRTRSAA